MVRHRRRVGEGVRYRVVAHGWLEALQGAPARLAPVASLLSWFYLSVVLWLLVWILLAWVALGWRPSVIHTDQLAPDVRAGDVMLLGRVADGLLGPGAIVALERGAPGGSSIARIREVTPGGTYVLSSDVEIAADEVRGVARLLVPAIASPLVWLRAGRLGLALLSVAVMAGAGVFSSRRILARVLEGLAARHPRPRASEWTARVP